MRLSRLPFLLLAAREGFFCCSVIHEFSRAQNTWRVCLLALTRQVDSSCPKRYKTYKPLTLQTNRNPEPCQPCEPSKPTNHINPKHPMNPTNPVSPTNSANPTNLTNPINPCKTPINPYKPYGAPAQSADTKARAQLRLALRNGKS